MAWDRRASTSIEEVVTVVNRRTSTLIEVVVMVVKMES